MRVDRTWCMKWLTLGSLGQRSRRGMLWAMALTCLAFSVSCNRRENKPISDEGPLAKASPKELKKDKDVTPDFGIESFSPDGAWTALYDKRSKQLFLRETSSKKGHAVPLGVKKGWGVYTPIWSPAGSAVAVSVVDTNKKPDRRFVCVHRPASQREALVEEWAHPLGWLDEETLVVQTQSEPRRVMSLKPFAQGTVGETRELSCPSPVGPLEGWVYSGGSYYVTHWKNGFAEPAEIARLRLQPNAFAIEMVSELPLRHQAQFLYLPSPDGTKWAVIREEEGLNKLLISDRPDLDASSSKPLAEAYKIELSAWAPGSKSIFVNMYDSDKEIDNRTALNQTREIQVPR